MGFCWTVVGRAVGSKVTVGCAVDEGVGEGNGVGLYVGSGVGKPKGSKTIGLSVLVGSAV